MPRAQRRIGKTEFDAPPFSLDQLTRSDLVELLGRGTNYDPHNVRHVRPICEIEKWLGFYEPAREAAKNIAGPADFKHALAVLDKKGEISQDDKTINPQIHAIVRRLSNDVRNATEAENAKWPMLREELAARAGLDSRGRPPKDYRDKLVKELRKIFRRYYDGGPESGCLSNGCIVELSTRDSDEMLFIIEALDSAEIDRPDVVRRLISAPEAALPGERVRITENIAKKFAKARIKKKK